MDDELIFYGVAYKDEYGEDFHGIPYLAGHPERKVKDAKETALHLEKEGKTNIIVFKFGKKWENTWKHVNDNKVI